MAYANPRTVDPLFRPMRRARSASNRQQVPTRLSTPSRAVAVCVATCIVGAIEAVGRIRGRVIKLQTTEC